MNLRTHDTKHNQNKRDSLQAVPFILVCPTGFESAVFFVHIFIEKIND